MLYPFPSRGDATGVCSPLLPPLPLRLGLVTPNAIATVARWLWRSSSCSSPSCPVTFSPIPSSAPAPVVLWWPLARADCLRDGVEKADEDDEVEAVAAAAALAAVAAAELAGLNLPSTAKCRISSWCLSEATSSCRGARAEAVLSYFVVLKMDCEC